jgi:serine/threonine protein kinase
VPASDVYSIGLVMYQLFTGGGPHFRDYKRGANIKFDKTTEPKYIELQIKDSTGKLQPEFEVKVWQ